MTFSDITRTFNNFTVFYRDKEIMSSFSFSLINCQYHRLSINILYTVYSSNTSLTHPVLAIIDKYTIKTNVSNHYNHSTTCNVILTL